MCDNCVLETVLSEGQDATYFTVLTGQRGTRERYQMITERR
jgi:hypothetical protein